MSSNHNNIHINKNVIMDFDSDDEIFDLENFQDIKIEIKNHNLVS
jgi:hypothetical protein